MLQQLLYILFVLIYCSTRQNSASPAFPDLFDTTHIENRRLHILAESVTEDNGYQTTEEFVDFDIGKETFIITDKSGHTITHVDAQANNIFRYRPYSCMKLEPEIIEKSEETGLWNAVVNFKPSNTLITPSIDNGNSKQFHLYGIVAVWLRAKELPKTYTTSSVVYSASKEIYKPAHKWTVEDENSKELISFYFIESNISTGKKMTLEMIQVEKKDSKRLIKTLNILSLDNLIHNQVYESLLQVPVGYGCSGSKYYDLNSKKSLDNSYIKILLTHSHKIDLEATATKYDELSDNDNEQKRYSDTISIELIRAKFEDYLGDNTIQLIRHRDTFKDVKKILNYHYNVQYELDLRKGTCIMSNMGKKYSTNNNENSFDESIFIKFDNNLKLNIDLKMMNTIFVNTDGFNYIKRIRKSSFRDHLYFEKTFDGNLFEDKQVSLIRTYSITSKHPSGQTSSSSSSGQSSSAYGSFDTDFDTNSDDKDDDVDEIKLESVTIWVFNEHKTQILESYHLNIIEAIELNNELELARIFDISDECYLNNEKMKDGKDFAWFELTYPVASHYGNILSTKTSMLKEQLYSLIFSGQLGLFRAPKIELMFIDTGFIVRALVLDIPPVELIFDVTENTSIMIDEQEDKKNSKPLDLLKEVAIDLKHCSDFCKFYKCKTMTFCHSNHRCLLSNYLYSTTTAITYNNDNDNDSDNYNKRVLISNQSCKTYTLPQDDIIDYDKIFELSLHRQLSKLQHQEYRDVTLPKMPYELIAPKSETNIDDEALEKLSKDYIDTLYKYIHDHEDEGFPAQIFSANIDGTLIILIPNKFELERDPLIEFDLSDKDVSLNDDDNDIGNSMMMQPTFHEGLIMQHYKLSLLLKRDGDDNKRKARLFNGINYDQCALACIDSRCSSFSYCSQRKECIITDIYDISSTITKSMIEQELDCFIAQRDFLSKFNKFPNVLRPNIYKKSSEAYNPSECAHSCMIETNFNCLAFDYCESDQRNEMATCFYLDTNNISSEEISAKKIPVQTSSNNNQTKRGCYHYNRSYLADFSRIQYRKIQDDEMLKLKTMTIEGRSVDQCADICINELTDCTAFQFCFNSENSFQGGVMQNCTMIESKPKDSETNYQIVLNHTTSTDGLSDGGQDEVVSAGKFIIDNDDCHLFSLRRDSTQAHLRDLALNSMTYDEFNNKGKNRNGNGGSAGSGTGLSIAGGFLLYFCLALISAAIGCGICIAKHRNHYVRKRIERIQMFLGL